MLEITVLHENVPIKTYESGADTITLGRLPENDIPIASISVSRRHLKIERVGSKAYLVTDLKSLNGTFFNDTKIDTLNITEPITLVIGKYGISFEISDNEEYGSSTRIYSADKKNLPPQPDSLQQSASDSESQQSPVPLAVVDEGEILEHPAPANKPAPMVAAPSETSSQLPRSTDGPVLIDTNKHVIYKIDKAVLSLGNSDADDIFVEGFMISDGHVVIEKTSDGFLITANKLMGKFKINGKKETRHLLSHKDRIEIGNSTFRFMETGSAT